MKEHLDLGRWPEADDLLDRALALPPEEREAFVRRATAHDRALGYALASIVREAGRDDGFLEPGGALTGDFGAEVGRALDLQPAAAHILTPGNSIEHYEVIELLGRGGMGEVYRARDRRINRDVALKVLLPQFADDPDRLARFRREAQVLAAINHPGIASIYGLAEQDSVRALVLEYVDGVTARRKARVGRHVGDRVGRDCATAGRSHRGRARGRHHPSRLETGQHHLVPWRRAIASGRVPHRR